MKVKDGLVLFSVALLHLAAVADAADCGWGDVESAVCRSVRAAVEDAQASVIKEEILPGGLLAVELAIRPEPESDIRVCIELPPCGKWNGELWGHGNSSFGGCFLGLGRYRDEGSAAVETDLGTARYVRDGDRAKQDWPEAVHRDYAWRATHLMTVYAKRAVLARYGRAQDHALFFGGSCGGRQAHSEAMRYPDDYDGIFSYTPAAIATVSSAQAFNVYRQAHDEQGNELFTTNHFRLLADAAVEFRKDRDEKPFAGRVLANPFWSEAEIDAFLDFVAAKDPSLGTPDRRARLKGIYTGAVDARGRRLCHGQLPGVMLGNPLGMSFRHAKLCSCNSKVTSPDGKPMVRQYGVFSPYPSWDEFEEKAVRHCGEINASATDLTPFFAHGGKFLVSCGLEDQTTPAPENIAWYEMLAANHGGIVKLKENCRLFVLPGVAHGGGQGRIAIAGAEDRHRDLLRQWVRKGVAPETYPLVWPAQNLTIPVPPYPERTCQDDKGGWRRTRYPENAVRHPDPRYLKTDPAPRTHTFMSYNVCECFGNWQMKAKGLGAGDRSPERYTNRLEEVTRIIRAASPEWCALQEVCHDMTNGVDHLSKFAARTGMHVEFADSATTWPGLHFGGGWGVALLSKVPPLKVRRFVAGHSEKHPRSVLAAEFKDYVVYAAHFTFADPYRVETVADVEAELDKETKPVFLVGDLNLQPTEKEVFERLQRKFTILTDGTGNTWPAVDPTQRLDYILVDTAHAKDWHKLRAWSLPEEEASDHRPIFLELVGTSVP